MSRFVKILFLSAIIILTALPARAGTCARDMRYCDYGEGGVTFIHMTTCGSARIRVMDADTGEETLTAHIPPHTYATLRFPPGDYILKIAEGILWISDEEAFGSTGSYTTTGRQTFGDSQLYFIVSFGKKGIYPDSREVFLR